jgi:DNA-binding response OmpR family regulator
MNPLQGRTCLVVDDDPNIREVVFYNLAAEGMKVHTVENGVEAEREALADPPDVIVLDVMMPGRDGYDVLDRLKQDERTRDIPVVLLTAKATDEEIWRGWRSGADYYITKPFSLDELIYFMRLMFAGVDEPV